MTKKRIYSPKYDYMFKQLFGQEINKFVLVLLLKTFLDLPDSEYDNIIFLKTHLKPRSRHGKIFILDILIMTSSGIYINIEFQKYKTKDIFNRIYAYASRLATSKIKRGEDYLLNKVINLTILDYEIDDEDIECIRYYHVKDNNNNLLIDDLKFVVVQLPKLLRSKEDSMKVMMARYLNIETMEDVEMLKKQESRLEHALDLLEELSQYQEEIDQIEYERMNEYEEKQRLAYAFQEGEEKGIEQGIEQGIEKGIEQGIEKGIEKTVLNMLINKFSISNIILATGLSLEQLNIIKAKINLN